MFSSSIELIHSPPDLIRSLARSVIWTIAGGVDGGDVAGVEPARGIDRVALGPVVGPADPRPAHHQLAGRRAVPRQIAAVRVDDPEVDAEQGAALLQAAAWRLARSGMRLPTAWGCCRRRPALVSVMPQPWVTSDAVLVAQRLEQGLRAGRAADAEPLQTIDPAA